MCMEKGNSVTFTRKTFKFGNSKSAITIPSALDIPVKTTVRVTIELAEDAPTAAKQ